MSAEESAQYCGRGRDTTPPEGLADQLKSFRDAIANGAPGNIQPVRDVGVRLVFQVVVTSDN